MNKKFPKNQEFNLENEYVDKRVINSSALNTKIKNRYKYYDNIISSLRDLLLSEFSNNVNESLIRDIIEMLVDLYIETWKLKIELKEKLRTVISARANITVKRSDLGTNNYYSSLIDDYVFALEVTNKFLASEQEMIETTFNMVWKHAIKLEEVIRDVFGFAKLVMSDEDLIEFINFLFGKFREIDATNQYPSTFLKLLPLDLIDKIVFNGISFEYPDNFSLHQA